MIIDICILVDGKIDFCTKAKNHKATFSIKEELEKEIENGAVFECEYCKSTLSK